MRIDPEVSTQRRAKSWGTAADPPTYLPNDEDLAVARKVQSDSVITSAPRAHDQASRRPSQSTVQRQPVRSVPAPSGARGSEPQVQAAAPRAPSPSQPAQRPSQPQVAEPPYAQFDGGASFDPLAIPLPPELAPSIFSWVRRLALQADLVGADRLLRDALADLTSSLSAIIIYASPDGLHSLGTSDELPKDTQPIQAVARARRAIVGTHSALIPITTTSETIAVIQLIRNTRQPAFSIVEHVTMAAIARESASVMHHLVVQHLQGRVELEADKKSLYRPEALDNHRKRGHEGALTELSPGWVRRTYHVLIIALVLAVFFAVFIKVPTYSSGSGVVVFNGTTITSPSAGTVDKVFVQSAQTVRKHTLLVRLKSDKEESDLKQATSELQATLQQYLFDRSDETIKKQLVTAQAATKRAEDAIEQKNVRATTDGTVSDIRIRAGGALEFGAQILTIVAPGTEPEVWAYLPGSDRPRLRPGQKLQIELRGYQKIRESATIYDVGRNVIGSTEAKRSLGQELGDALKLVADGGSYVLVKARLPKRTFKAKGRVYNYHPGMPAKTEVRVEQKRFVVTLLPSLEKYLP